MKKHIWVFFLVLFFGVLLSPVKLKAMQPLEAYPLGIVVEIDGCEESNTLADKYIVDVVVQKDQLSTYRTVANYDSFLPEALREGEYANLENEWISLLLFTTNTEFQNSDCSCIMFPNLYSILELEFTEFKVVVYEKGEDPVESKVYFTRNLAAYDELTGFKIIYSPEDQSFSLQGYEAEYEGFSDGGFFNFLQFLFIAFVVVLILIFGCMESVIYLIAKRGKRAILIALVFNVTAIGIALVQMLYFFDSIQTVSTIVGLMFIPGLYAAKVLLLFKYETRVYQVSILLSVMFYMFPLLVGIITLR